MPTHLVDHGRHDAGRRADADAADQQLRLEQIVDVLHRRLRRGGADPAGKRRRAEPVVAARVGLDVRKLHHRLARQVARDRAEHGAVARRTHIDVIRRRQRRRLRHVLHHDGRLAGQLLGQVFRQQPRAEVVVVADLVADDERKLAALVELRRALRLRAASAEAIDESRDDSQRSANTRHPTLPTYSAARFCISAAAALS